MDASSQHSPGASLLESIQNSLVAAAEIGSNRMLGFDQQALDACAELQGSCIAIDITDLDFQLYCHPGNWGIRLSREQPGRESDARISGRLMALINLASEDDKVSTSIQEGVSFSGKVALAQKLQSIVSNLEIDWEEMLARHTGDIAAFQIHQQMRKLGHWARHSADSLLQTSSEYLREEARLSPTQVEFDEFQSQLRLLKNNVARAEARLQQILSKIPLD